MTKTHEVMYFLRAKVAPMVLDAPMAITGYRFDKSWRHAPDGSVKACVYAYLLNTVFANYAADDLAAWCERQFDNL